VFKEARDVFSRNWLWIAVLAAAVVAGWFLVQRLTEPELPSWIAAGNGRIEAVSIDIASKTGGRVREILVDEGDTVEQDQILAYMDTQQLEAQLREAQAQLQRGKIAREVAESNVTQAEAEYSAAQAVIAQRQAELETAERQLERSEQLVRTNAISQQTLDTDRARAASARAALDVARAQAASAQAAIATAKASIVDADAAIEAAEAAIERIQVEINDSVLRAPRDGRIQYRVAQPGEVIASGGRVLNLIDLNDVYMTFFLPTVQAGRVAVGAEARIVLDTAPNIAVPAEVSFVSDVAQFTPKTVETKEERLDLMFRVKVRVPPELLQKYARYVKPGMPGMAYVKLDPNAEWPESLRAGVLE